MRHPLLFISGDTMEEEREFIIDEELKKLPGRPGVYIMHDLHDTIIYVGKAVSLKNRVRQYFQSSRGKSAKIMRMVEHIDWSVVSAQLVARAARDLARDLPHLVKGLLVIDHDTLDVFMQPIKEGIKVKIENLFFATNKTYILPQSEQSMSDLANFLLDNPSVKIHVVGHTDAVGTDEANQILSEGRANSVRNDLIKRGVAAERITAEGKGEKEPVADNDTEEGRQLNRRVEFTITDVGNEDIQQIY